MNDVIIKVSGLQAARTADAIHRVVAERARQVSEEGYTPERDLHYHQGELARAASCYAMPRGFRRTAIDGRTPLTWPWSPHHWKPADFAASQTTEGRLRDLEKAGALILAEMERLMALGDL